MLYIRFIIKDAKWKWLQANETGGTGYTTLSPRHWGGNWYKLGDEVLFLMRDTKSMTSFSYRAMDSWERGGNSFWGNMGGNTYQTYIWTESYYEVSSKAQIKQEFERQQIQTEVDRTKSVPIYDKY